jgi:hypothetical protein
VSYARISRNDPCPCGSGRKFKHCCYGRGGSITKLDRQLAIELIEQFAETCTEIEDAYEIFVGDLDVEHPAVTDYYRDVSESAFLFWFVFDYRLQDGSFIVDRILRTNPLLSVNERSYLEQLRQTAMMPYEVVGVRPGESVVVRQLGETHEITIREKTASRTLKRWDLMAARINPLGPSGGAEFEMGLMLYPPAVRDDVEQLVDEICQEASHAKSALEFYKEYGPDIYQIWLETVVDPPIPELQTPDGEPVVWVTMTFDILDEDRVRAALDAEPSLEQQDGVWQFDSDDGPLGTIEVTSSRLILNSPSISNADRARVRIEQITSDAIVFLESEQTDVREEVVDMIRSGVQPERDSAADEIPPEIKDRLFQEFMAKHTEEWLDEQIPALDDRTPREAAQTPALKPRLVQLLRENENHYLHALTRGEPAFDPTWMWDELGLADHSDAPGVRHPLSLPHVMMAQHIDGLEELVHSVAERRRGGESTLVRSAITAAELEGLAEVKLLIDTSRRKVEMQSLLSHLVLYCNFELQRRKTFWVDGSLAWMLSNTQVDADGSYFRLPFSSYALVYSDRHTLGMAERALASEANCPLRGMMLGILCAYVVELEPECSCVRVGLAFDAYSGQLPHLITFDLQIDPNQSVESAVADALAQTHVTAPGLFAPILNTVINATLYTTSAGVRLEQYQTKGHTRAGKSEPDKESANESVYHLPGKINISHLKKLQQLARRPSGRAMLHRFMVRGHWRRPNPNWKEQSARWIEPYWRGPSLASIVEREYRLGP